MIGSSPKVRVVGRGSVGSTSRALVDGVAVRPVGPRALAAPPAQGVDAVARQGGEDDAAGAVLRVRLLPRFSANPRGVRRRGSSQRNSSARLTKSWWNGTPRRARRRG